MWSRVRDGMRMSAEFMYRHHHRASPGTRNQDGRKNRSQKAPNRRTIPTFAISRSMSRWRKSATSRPAMRATIAKTQRTVAPCRPMRWILAARDRREKARQREFVSSPRGLPERPLPTVVSAPKGRNMERPEDLKALARRCRELAAATADEDTRKSLELLAEDYEASAAQSEAEPLPNETPQPEA